MDKKTIYLIGMILIIIGVLCLGFAVGVKDVKADTGMIHSVGTTHDMTTNTEIHAIAKMKCVLIDYPNMYCDDGYVYNRNEYKILHVTQINEWLHSKNKGAYANGLGWFSQIKDVEFDW